jgi:hypothetical protein
VDHEDPIGVVVVYPRLFDVGAKDFGIGGIQVHGDIVSSPV